jgi:hypothetical protein
MTAYASPSVSVSWTVTWGYRSFRPRHRHLAKRSAYATSTKPIAV